MANKVPNGKLTNNQRSAVRVVMAAGATLMMLVSAQMFATAGAVSTARTSTSAATQNTSTTQNSTSLFNSDDSNTILLTTDQGGTIYYDPFQQPVPSSHSSR